MKLNGYLSTGNIIVIATILVSISIAWGSMNASLVQLQAELDLKAPKNVTDVKFEYIHKELIEIKQLLEIVFTNAQ